MNIVWFIGNTYAKVFEVVTLNRNIQVTKILEHHHTLSACLAAAQWYDSFTKYVVGCWGR